MYEKLTASLRYCSETNSLSLYKRELMKAAADAIEDLSKTLDEEVEINTALGCNMPVWIPVTERLPEPKFAREWYLVHLESGCVKTLAFEKSGTPNNMFKDGWHETASRVTHWMPLPEPPKDGE